MPFNDTTTIGYNVAFLVQLIGSWVICAIICTVNSFFFGVCWYFEALIFDLKSIFVQINNRLGDKRYATATARIVIRQKLNEFIGFHTNIIALVTFSMWNFLNMYLFFLFSNMNTHFCISSVIDEFRDLMSGTIFVTFAISVTWLCTSLFQIHAVRGFISTLKA